MASKDPKLDLLHSIDLFSGCSRGDLERLARLADEVDVPAGYVLMRQGASGSEAFVVIAGKVQVERDGTVIAERGPGEVIGEIALLAEGPRTATATAIEPSRLFVFGSREFHTLMQDQPTILSAVLGEVARRLRALEGGLAR